MCWLYDKYGHLERNCKLKNFRLIKPDQDDNRMITVEGRLELREELLWETGWKFEFRTKRKFCGVVVAGCDPYWSSR